VVEERIRKSRVPVRLLFAQIPPEQPFGAVRLEGIHARAATEADVLNESSLRLIIHYPDCAPRVRRYPPGKSVLPAISNDPQFAIFPKKPDWGLARSER
jgi:hypothetical protein